MKKLNRIVQNSLRIYVVMMLLCTSVMSDEIPEEFKIKRQNDFTFKTSPIIKKTKENISIQFETNSFCDVTIVVEDSTGKILRHLVSGVLGSKAPYPFVTNSKKQNIKWDYKNDSGRYLKDIPALTIRVSLGLKAQFEKTLLWSPEKRIARRQPAAMASFAGGVLQFEGEGVDQLKLFSHDGNYIKTIYPFAAKDLSKVKGLKIHEFQQDKKKLPLKFGSKHFSTFLKTGSNMDRAQGKYGSAANAIVIHGNKIGLIGRKLGILPLQENFEDILLEGPSVIVPYTYRGKPFFREPSSAAISPDGKWVYLAGYGNYDAVKRIEFSATGKLEHFAGKKDGKHGKGLGEFDGVASVACDAKGRVYVADYINDRIQVFDVTGKHLKSLKVKKPYKVMINPKNGDVYVTSWLVTFSKRAHDSDCKKPLLYHFSNLDSWKLKGTYGVPLVGYARSVFMNEGRWKTHAISMDFHGSKPTIWLVPGAIGTLSKKWLVRGKIDSATQKNARKLYQFEKNKLKLVHDFGPVAMKKVKRLKPGILHRQRIYFNPMNNNIYIAEGDSGVMKSFKALIEINPDSGNVKIVRLPYTTEDLCFDHIGNIYLRTDTAIGRFEFKTMKEIPFDYGNELNKVGFDGSRGVSSLISGIALPTSGKPGQFHLGGMSVNFKLHLAVSCYNRKTKLKLEGLYKNNFASLGNIKYAPKEYPGRIRYAEIHVWDERGKSLYEDAFPGLGITDGIEIDNEDNLYVMFDGVRMLGKKPYFNKTSETLVKVKPKACKVMSKSKKVSVPLTSELFPKRAPDVVQSSTVGTAWVEGAKWFYGGVGFAGFNDGAPSCSCWNARFSLDKLKRSFVPEVDHYSIAVLDSNGSLIMRIGQYGNIEDGKPLVKAGGPAITNSIGGDEVALFHAAYVGVHSDKRLFISDAGNSRILSVKLDYHTNKVLSLK
ncbi:MAG: hypothetical protein COA79_06440 [Planctomycetota bacterium]|nr:MAG: hypothetical protein COA79_06440 [Planctomycetota bacterium]